jgi:hypothetical protein
MKKPSINKESKNLSISAGTMVENFASAKVAKSEKRQKLLAEPTKTVASWILKKDPISPARNPYQPRR